MPKSADQNSLTLEQEAAHILRSILRGVAIRDVANDNVLIVFEADPDLHDRLCMWGCENEDLEDDCPEEDDGLLEDDGLDEFDYR